MPIHPFGSILSDAQATTLRAVLDRMIPADDYDDYPGAWDAGVGDYLARQLQGDLAACLSTYRDGLNALDLESESRFVVGFSALDAARQDEMLASLERGEAQADWNVSPETFIEMLANHVAEGYYSDPGNGGNRDCAAWRMVGFDPRWTVSRWPANRWSANVTGTARE